MLRTFTQLFLLLLSLTALSPRSFQFLSFRFVSLSAIKVYTGQQTHKVLRQMTISTIYHFDAFPAHHMHFNAVFLIPQQSAGNSTRDWLQATPSRQMTAGPCAILKRLWKRLAVIQRISRSSSSSSSLHLCIAGISVQCSECLACRRLAREQ